MKPSPTAIALHRCPRCLHNATAPRRAILVCDGSARGRRHANVLMRPGGGHASVR
jgi:hypothetical protein